MSADIEITDGRANVLGRKTWWHRLNEGLGRNANREDIKELCPVLVETVEKVALRDLILDPTITVPEDEFVTLRSDGKLIHAGMGSKYECVQAMDNYDWGLQMAQVITGKSGDLLISAGSIREGRQGFFVFEGDRFEVGGVEFRGYLNLLFSHDGTIPNLLVPSNIVTVCANTFSMNVGGKAAFRFRHTATVDDRMRQAYEAQKVEAELQGTFAEKVSKLQLRKVSGKDLDGWVSELFPLGTEEKPVSTRMENENTRAQDAVYSLFNAPLNDGVEKSGWAFVQAVNSYEQWQAPTRKTKGMGSETTRALRQFDSLLRGQPLTSKATEMALA